MAENWSPNTNIFQPTPAPAPAAPALATAKDGNDSDPETQYDRERRERLAAQPHGFDGWRTELCQYLAQEEDRSVSKKTDLCEYWTVRCPSVFLVLLIVPTEKLHILSDNRTHRAGCHSCARLCRSL